MTEQRNGWAGWSRTEHTVEPDPRTMREDEGRYLGTYAARCAYCGAPINGDEDSAWHEDE